MFLDSFVKIFAHLDYRALIDNNDNFLILKSTVPACVVCYASEIAGLGLTCLVGDKTIVSHESR
jgi:hypothetical protein